MQELARSVDRDRSRWWRIRPSIGVTAGITAAAIAVLALLPEHRDTMVVIDRTAPPVVVTVERVVEAAVPAPPDPPPTSARVTALRCPAIAVVDEPIGVPVQATPTSDYDPSATVLHVVASSAAPRIAVLSGSEVLVSDDDGKTFARAFTKHDVEQIAIAPDGTLYARGADKLGVTPFPGRVASWRKVALGGCESDGTCEGDQCSNRIAAVEDRVVWFHNDQLATSTDQGRHWKRVKTTDQSWSSTEDGQLLPFRGALYQAYHYTERCGIDDTSTWRLDRSGRIEHTIFHNYYEEREPVLEASNDVDTEWAWRERCWGDNANKLVSCSKRIPSVSEMLRVATLRLVEGARTLAVYGGSLIELCGDSARQIYRAFPFATVAAVDSAGRSLVVDGGAILRWSPLHGWRRLYKAE